MPNLAICPSKRLSAFESDVGPSSAIWIALCTATTKLVANVVILKAVALYVRPSILSCLTFSCLAFSCLEEAKQEKALQSSPANHIYLCKVASMEQQVGQGSEYEGRAPVKLSAMGF